MRADKMDYHPLAPTASPSILPTVFPPSSLMVAHSRLNLSLLSTLCLALALAPAVFAALPFLDDPVQADRVVPTVRVGKALLFPLTASDADVIAGGDALTYEVKSSDPKIAVTVKTGDPHLKLTINHAGNGTPADPAFNGVLEFQLLRELTPITCDIIAGLAQAGFYNGLKFHRIADLDSKELPSGSFIAQGGDPLGTGSGGPGFTFEDEQKAPLLFSGRGQLAMANSGTNPNTYTGTNGSQFFVTDGSPRFLDFNHTIFGQLVRGWDILDKLMAVPTTSSVPTVDVTITTAEIVPNFTDAVLFLAATGLTTPTADNITVKVTDRSGDVAMKTFKATSIADTINSPPFFVPPTSVAGPKFTVIEIPLQSFDLEFDLVSYANGLIDPVTNGQRGQSGSFALVRGNPGYVGPLTLAVALGQYDVTYRSRFVRTDLLLGEIRVQPDGEARAFDDLRSIPIAVGDLEIVPEPVLIEAQPGAALTGVSVARFLDRSTQGAMGNFTASINWGDATATLSAISAGTLAHDPTRAALTGFVVQGTHTFASPGVYPITVRISDSLGFRATVRSTAIVTAATFRAAGRVIDIAGAATASPIVATFTDTAPLAASAYTATINWGDGAATLGVAKLLADGSFSVTGSHRYRDPEVYSVTVRIHKEGASAATDPVAWSTAHVSGFRSAPHLPPFAQTRLSVELPDAPVIVRTGSGSRLRTAMKVRAVIRNSGTKKSPPAQLRFYLSKDKTLNTTGPDADIPLTIGSLTKVVVPPLRAGGATAYVFDAVSFGDFRLKGPPGETGIGYNILASLPYKDPIGDYQNVSRVGLYGPLGIIAGPENVTVTEVAGGNHSTTISVVLDETPTADVTIGLSASDGRIVLSKTQLVFTPANAKTPEQTFTVTAVGDAIVNGTSPSKVIFAPTVSTDPIWSGRQRGDITVTVIDDEIAP